MNLATIVSKSHFNGCFMDITRQSTHQVFIQTKTKVHEFSIHSPIHTASHIYAERIKSASLHAAHGHLARHGRRDALEALDDGRAHVRRDGGELVDAGQVEVDFRQVLVDVVLHALGKVQQKTAHDAKEEQHKVAAALFERVVLQARPALHALALTLPRMHTVPARLAHHGVFAIQLEEARVAADHSWGAWWF